MHTIDIVEFQKFLRLFHFENQAKRAIADKFFISDSRIWRTDDTRIVLFPVPSTGTYQYRLADLLDVEKSLPDFTTFHIEDSGQLIFSNFRGNTKKINPDPSPLLVNTRPLAELEAVQSELQGTIDLVALTKIIAFFDFYSKKWEEKNEGLNFVFSFPENACFIESHENMKKPLTFGVEKNII